MEWVQKPSVWDFSGNLNKPLGGSSKRAKATVRTLNLSCLVDGCVSDLSNCRDYHRRHRVCEQHSKTPVVTVGGKERRFCQQCSRFQCLGEFDEEKRSCRKRLEGHNRRRRKLQPATFYLNSGSFLSLDRGKGLVQMSKPSVLPAWSEFAEKPDNLPDNGPKTTTSTALARVYNGRNGLILRSSPYSDDISHLTTSGQGLRTTLLSGILTESIETRRALSFLSSKQNLSPSGDFGNFAQHYSSQGEGEAKPRVPFPHPERDVDTLQRGGPDVAIYPSGCS